MQAEVDGTFEMPNVPASMGNIKARTTCVRDGQTLTGETDYFTVTRGEEVDVGDFHIAAEALIPARLIITSGANVVLGSVGATSYNPE